jgi:hypothetical protein
MIFDEFEEPLVCSEVLLAQRVARDALSDSAEVLLVQIDPNRRPAHGVYNSIWGFVIFGLRCFDITFSRAAQSFS